MPEALKNGLNKSAITRLAANLKRVFPTFDSTSFVSSSCKGLGKLELKERVAHVACQLAKYLPSDYSKALSIIVESASQWNRGQEDDPLRGFAAWPLFRYIEVEGLHEPKASLAALREITHLFSAEFAIRPFIESNPKQVFAELKKWTTHKSEHVRRLVSEGIRPRLPWATKVDLLIESPEPIIKLLELLKDDSELYVRRSVANNLNDIAKDHPDVVLDLCYRWAKDASPEREWIIQRATRTLVKDGHPRVWGLLGFSHPPLLSSSAIALSPKSLAIGGAGKFSLTLTSTGKKKQRLAVDYAIHYIKANGKARAKVFKLKVFDLAPGQTFSIEKSHSFVERSTRKHYPGTHTIELLVNGESMAKKDFALKAAQ